MIFERHGQFLYVRVSRNVAAILSGKTAARPCEWQVFGQVSLLTSCIPRSKKLDMTSRKYSEYFELQEKQVKERYVEKLNLIGPEVDDPYAMPDPAVLCTDAMPDVEYPDIY